MASNTKVSSHNNWYNFIVNTHLPQLTTPVLRPILSKYITIWISMTNYLRQLQGPLLTSSTQAEILAVVIKKTARKSDSGVSTPTAP